MNKLSLLGASLAAVFLIGCAANPPKPIPLPNGGTGYSVTCFNENKGCYMDAAALCKGPYEMVDRSTQLTALGYGQFMSTIDYIVQCKQ